MTGTKATITYGELRDRVARLAGALAARGVGKGDRVIIYMPMVPEALVAMLACARLGAVHSVVFGGFAAPELAVRIDDARPKAVIATSCGIEPGRVVAYKPLLDAAIEIAAHKPDFCVVLQRPQAPADAGRGPRRRLGGLPGRRRARRLRAGRRDGPALHPLHLRHDRPAEGGRPSQRRAHGGAHLDDGATSTTSKPGEVFWAASDVGWVVGHSYICYAPLLIGATTIVFEGKPVGTPDAGTFWRVIEEHGVGSFFTAPTAFRAIKREDPEGKLLADYDLAALRYLFLAGERADPDTIDWAQRQTGVPVIDHWWQTETGWPIAANPAGIELLPVKLGSPTVPMPGYDVRILAGDRRAAAAGRARRGGDPPAAAAGDAADAVERREPLRAQLPHHLPRLLRDRRRRR